MLSPVDEIKSRLDIVDIVQEYVPLKAAGVNMKGLCPFHREKTPSFTVHKGKQMWHCFGCNVGGDMFTFIEKIENVEFPEALEILAKKANVELIREDPQLRSERQRLKELLFAAAQWYAGVLKGQKGTDALKYLKEKRLLNDNTVEEWQIGYAPGPPAGGWEELVRFLRTKGYRDQEMVAAGMAISRQQQGEGVYPPTNSRQTQTYSHVQSVATAAPQPNEDQRTVTGIGGGVYDRFRDRIMFPIRDAHGTVVGFTGRQLHDNKEAGGKYVNTPETLLYHKGSVLFGFDKAKGAMRDQGYALLVEGQMDVISLWQHGFQHAVAVSGTALTADQLRLLKRVAETLVLCFDADPGGSSASSRGIELAWQEGFAVKIATLPEGEAKDPDELVRKDKAAFAHALQESQPILEYLFSRARRTHPGQSVEEKKAVAKALLPALVKLADPIEQDHYLKLLAEELGVAESSLRDALAKAKPAVRPRVSSTPPPAPTPPLQRSAERLLAALVSSPALLQQMPSLLDGEELDEPYRALYTEMVSWYSTSSQDNSDELFHALMARVPEAHRLIESIGALGALEYQNKNAQELLAEARTLGRALKRHYLKQRFTVITRAIADAERAVAHAGGSEAEARLEELLHEFNGISETLHQLELNV